MPRRDKCKEKEEILSKMINEACHEENIPVINHSNINPKKHLNRSKVLFNNYGNSVFVKSISEIFLDILESSSIFENDLNKMKMQRLEHFHTLIVGHLNINSIINKFEIITEIIKNFDIFLISESKIDSTFPNMQFRINSYKLVRRDRNRFSKGLMLYLNEEISCKFLNNHSVVPNTQIICIEFHQLKRKWLLLGCYKLPTQSELKFLATITKTDYFYLQKNENLFIIDNLNMTTENTNLNDILQIYDLIALIQEPTCYQLQNPNCIDHFLSNRKTLFKHCQKL